MPNIVIGAGFEPDKIKANKKEEVAMDICITSTSQNIYWCECTISVKSPLSLAHDKELSEAKARVGIVTPMGTREKKIKLYTRPNNFADTYVVNITAFIYDQDGAIAERIEHSASIVCES